MAKKSDISVTNSIKKDTLKKFHEIIFLDALNNTETKSKVFQDKYYDIVFYNINKHDIDHITLGKVLDIEPDVINVLSMNIDKKYMNKNEVIDKILDSEKMSIPINNIYKITEVDIKEKPKETKKEVVLISILGLSSEVIKSVIVRLRLFDDDIRYRATPVDMIVGNIYNVSYYNKSDNTVYEVKGKLISIDSIEKFEHNLNGFVRPEEIVGCGNTIYDKDHFYSLKKDYPKGENIRFLFDSSDPLEAHSDYVYLKDIRNVELLKDNSSSDGLIENNCPYKNGCYRLEHGGEDKECVVPPGYNCCCKDNKSYYPDEAKVTNVPNYPFK